MPGVVLRRHFLRLEDEVVARIGDARSWRLDLLASFPDALVSSHGLMM